MPVLCLRLRTIGTDGRVWTIAGYGLGIGIVDFGTVTSGKETPV
jgi:hypothetical protein